MYRMNNCGSTPRDRLDPRLFERLSTRQDEEACHRYGDSANACPLRQMQEDCNCAPYTASKDDENFDYALAMVYSQKQSWQNIYSVEEGLKTGTIFQELNKPFYGAKCHGGSCND